MEQCGNVEGSRSLEWSADGEEDSSTGQNPCVGTSQDNDNDIMSGQAVSPVPH